MGLFSFKRKFLRTSRSLGFVTVLSLTFTVKSTSKLKLRKLEKSIYLEKTISSRFLLYGEVPRCHIENSVIITDYYR